MAPRLSFVLWLLSLASVGAGPAAEERLTNAMAVNPHVQPGLVHWHKDFGDACAAAKKSGKAVLLFHLMGKLDQQFC